MKTSITILIVCAFSIVHSFGGSLRGIMYNPTTWGSVPTNLAGLTATNIIGATGQFSGPITGAVLTATSANISGTLTGATVIATLAKVTAGLSASNAFVGGVVFWTTGAFTNLNGVPGTLTNLANYSVPAHMLTNNGDRLIGEWQGTFALATANTNNFQLTWGGTTFLDTGLQIASNTTFSAWCQITRTGNSAQHVDGRFTWGPGGGVPFVFTNVNLEMTINAGTAQILALKGSAARGGAHTNNSMIVTFIPGPR